MTNDEILKSFDEHCILTKFGECKYWNPSAFGYKDDDMECSMDKFFPEEVKKILLSALEAKDKEVVDRNIDQMVDLFLGWKLPEDFCPDAGITFKRTFNEHLEVPMRHEPIGTNLLTATQAKEMVKYMLSTSPSQPSARD